MIKIPLIHNAKILKLSKEQGPELLCNALLNKDSAFSEQERRDFALEGFLPPEIEDLKKQCEAAYAVVKRYSNGLDKFIFLRELQDTNETLFYALLSAHTHELLPFVYTPTLATACKQYSQLYQRPRGLFLSYPLKESMKQILAHSNFEHTRLIVVTDAEHVLSIGDQGIGGMAISIGKLMLYCLCAGIHPQFTLPILLDTGTNNVQLINDPNYKGWRHERIRGKEYDDFLASFVDSVRQQFPNIVLHMEDFDQDNANKLLNLYRHEFCALNGDIQGTGAIALSTVLAALKVTKQSWDKQTIVIVGAGAIACEIAELIIQSMQRSGIEEKIAREKIFLVDPTLGVIHDQMPNLFSYQQKLAQPLSRLSSIKHGSNIITLSDVVNFSHPTILIGNCGQTNIFSEAIIRDMAKHTAQPIILPLSNPADKSEATPQDLLTWTNGQAIIATGTAFPAVSKNGEAFRIDQANNMYLFPGIGLALLATQAKKLSDGMVLAAAYALAKLSPAKDNPHANLFPDLTQIREISVKIAYAVAQQGIQENCIDANMENNLEQRIRDFMWVPRYLDYQLK